MIVPFTKPGQPSPQGPQGPMPSEQMLMMALASMKQQGRFGPEDDKKKLK